MRAAAAARLAGGPASTSTSANGSLLGNAELRLRLRETQALLIKFSEENSRLAHDNEALQAGRKLLSSEHANVLDEIDLLRGKLSQLEHSVLAAAAAGVAASGGGAAGQPVGAAAAGGAGAGATAAQGAAAGGTLDVRLLLSSLGLTPEAVTSLTSIGEGPLEGRGIGGGGSGSPEPPGSQAGSPDWGPGSGRARCACACASAAQQLRTCMHAGVSASTGSVAAACGLAPPPALPVCPCAAATARPQSPAAAGGCWAHRRRRRRRAAAAC